MGRPARWPVKRRNSGVEDMVTVACVVDRQAWLLGRGSRALFRRAMQWLQWEEKIIFSATAYLSSKI
ncbi:hypothetical protein BN1708_006618 [Verticillium longisporum]|uniref:Uncharacterized protein n=1 Tax=Verticillium longisporum TaxID=100787 RepID=A0A0G4MLA6_VERLO|nr:hypothetical protein BN1708_006618 [Verticillium longisporum]